MAHLYFLGISYDLLSLRPEICLLLIILDNNWFYNHSTGFNNSARFKFNMEHALPEDLSLKQEPVLELPIDQLYHLLNNEKIINPSSIAPCSVGILKLASEFFSKKNYV